MPYSSVHKFNEVPSINLFGFIPSDNACGRLNRLLCTLNVKELSLRLRFGLFMAYRMHEYGLLHYSVQGCMAVLVRVVAFLEVRHCSSHHADRMGKFKIFPNTDF